MAWYRNPARLWLISGVLLVALGVLALAGGDQEETRETQPARIVDVESPECLRAARAGKQVAKAAGAALYVAPLVDGLVRDALAAIDQAGIENVQEHLRAVAPTLRRARSFSERGDAPAWWRFDKWRARCLGEPVVSATYDPPVGNRGDARRTVRRFMQARLRGRGAKYFVASDGRDEFGRAGGLRPLYPKRMPEDFAIVFVDDLGEGSYEVGVELVFARGGYGDTLFVTFDGFRYRITGGRPGLEGP